MSRVSITALVLTLVAAFGCSTELMAAKKNKSPKREPQKREAPAPEVKPQCGGADMLPELATTDPALHAKLMSSAAATENGSALLWKIERAGLEPSHIFGTVHLTDPRVAQLPAKAKAVLSKASTVVLEVADLSASTSAVALSGAMRLAVFTDGTMLDKLVTADEFALVQKAVERGDMPPDAARFFKPWIVTMLMSSTECERKKVQSGALVQDMQIAATAKKRGVPVVGLETVESQLEALAAIPQDRQLDMLRASLPYADRTSDLVETTVQLYLKRNIGAVWPLQLALAEKAGIEPTAFEAFQTRLVNDRNVRMRDKALEHLAKGGAFVAVGALHLPGKAGLVQLIRDAGYTVTPVE